MRHLALLAAVALISSLASAADKPKDRNALVREDKPTVTKDERWVYNDLAKGIEAAKKEGKPLLIVFRCIPCHACSGFDAAVLQNATDRLKPLMDQFICVRIIQANAMDLALFQFDYDLSFAAFFMNADTTIYGRYGTRSDLKDTERDVSMDSFSKAMQGALDLHKGYPGNKSLFAGKHGPAVKYARPELYPMLTKFKPTLDFEGQVVQSCIHCHQIRDAERQDLRAKKQPITDHVLYPYPLPETIGLKLDAKEKAKVVSVADGSAAHRAGLLANDEIVSLNGQPMLSIADVQWVLHNMGDAGTIKVEANRQGGSSPKPRQYTITLASGWRKASDISWRTTSWEFRRFGLGGMFPGDMTDEERKTAKLDTTQMAFVLKYVGEHGEFARAKQAGFRKGDIIIAFDGKTDRMRETDLLAYVVQQKKPGDKIAATVLREGKKVELTLTLP